jgi:hypothetical protein
MYIGQRHWDKKRKEKRKKRKEKREKMLSPGGRVGLVARVKPFPNVFSFDVQLFQLPVFLPRDQSFLSTQASFFVLSTDHNQRQFNEVGHYPSSDPFGTFDQFGRLQVEITVQEFNRSMCTVEQQC